MRIEADNFVRRWGLDMKELMSKTRTVLARVTDGDYPVRSNQSRQFGAGNGYATSGDYAGVVGH